MAAFAFSLNSNAWEVVDDDDENYSLDDFKSQKKFRFQFGFAYGGYTLAKGNSQGLNYFIGGSMDIAEKFPISARLIYAMPFKDLSINGLKDTKVSSLSLPIHIGYRYQPNKRKEIYIGGSLGPYLNYQFAKDKTYSSRSTLVSLSELDGYKKLVFGGSAKIDISIGSFFNIFAEYGLGLTERVPGEKDNFWQVGYYMQF